MTIYKIRQSQHHSIKRNKNKHGVITKDTI